MHTYTPPKVPRSIPVIDLGRLHFGASARQGAAAEIHRAYVRTGFFYVSHHGIDSALIEKQFDFTKKFFDLPIKEKMSIWMKSSSSASGYEPIGGQALDSQDATQKAAPPDLKESFTAELSCQTIILTSPPASGVLGKPVPGGYRTVSRADASLWCRVARLGDTILELMALSLDLQSNWFAPHFATAGAKLRLIKYSPQQEAAVTNQLGAGAHTDWGGITILAQVSIGGLEVQMLPASGSRPSRFPIRSSSISGIWWRGGRTESTNRIFIG